MSESLLKTELKTIAVMIKMYCRYHHNNNSLCQECTSLQEYAFQRIEMCKFGFEKPVCNMCRVHCYKPEKREQIRQIMRWAGPRMMYFHPILAIKHLRHKKRIISEK